MEKEEKMNVNIRNILKKIVYTLPSSLRNYKRISGVGNEIMLGRSLFTRCDIKGDHNRVRNQGNIKGSKLEIHGNNNKIDIGKNSALNNVLFHISGDNHTILIGEGVFFSLSGNIWHEDNNTWLEIGDNTKILSAHFAVVEDDSRIVVGKDNMFSFDIELRTSDSHSIIDIKTNERVNKAKNIILKDHIWLSARCIILKGVRLESDTVVGIGSIVTKSPGEGNVIIAGMPGKIVKRGITWKEERIYE
jgi:acetyltransferase-like isoleucine patch superfamily enzyme